MQNIIEKCVFLQYDICSKKKENGRAAPHRRPNWQCTKNPNQQKFTNQPPVNHKKYPLFLILVCLAMVAPSIWAAPMPARLGEGYPRKLMWRQHVQYTVIRLMVLIKQHPKENQLNYM